MNNPMAIILAGGLGTRLGPLAGGLPKPMVQVGGVPFLEHTIRQLASQGFEKVLLLVGHQSEVIEAYFRDGAAFGLQIEYSRETEPLGTGGALRQARPMVDRPFLLLYGDVFRQIDYRHRMARAAGNAMGIYPFTPGLTTISCGNVKLAGDIRKGMHVARYVKNRPELSLPYVDAGFGCYQPEVLRLLPEGRSELETHLYPLLAAEGRLGAILVDREFYDIGNPDDLAATRDFFESKRYKGTHLHTA